MKLRVEGGKWRDFDQTLTCAHTVITKRWKYGDKTFQELFLCPFGMVETMVKFHNNSRNTVFSFMRAEVKNELQLSAETYDRSKLDLSVSHMGNLGVKKFQHVVCRKCMDITLPAVRKHHKLSEDVTIEFVISNWDKLKISSKDVDLAGCLLPHEPHVNAGPNARRFIERPETHDLHEKYSKTQPSEQPPTTDIQATPTGPVLSSSNGMLGMKRKITDEGSSTTVVRDNENVVVHVGRRTQDSIKMRPVNTLIDPKINLRTPCSDKSDIWSKNFMLKLLHTGVNKHISNQASLEIYETVMDGIHEYHNDVIPDITINNKKLCPPPKVSVNKDNIDVPLDALLHSFQNSSSTSNPYNCLLKQESGK